MKTQSYDFDSLNEADVREEIVAPLLRALNYRAGTQNNIVREQPLNYPRAFLGKKKKSDPILRGRADYICEVKNNVRWVIETKAPAAILDSDSIEQGWSYANHPEVRAVYFCLTNGRHFKVFQTNKGPDAPPILEWDYHNMEESFGKIQNLLGPDSIIREHPTYHVDVGEPIGQGLRSIVRITNGFIIYETNSLNIPALTEMITTITDGSIEHDENGRMEAHVETLVPFQSLQELNQRLGLHSMILRSEDKAISSDPARPTRFHSIREVILPQGEKVLNLTIWQKQSLPCNIPVRAETTGIGALQGHTFSGQFRGRLDYPSLNLKIAVDGSFQVHLS